MNRRTFLLAAVLAALSGRTEAAPPLVEVYKSPTCGCCNDWVKHLRANGFEVRATDVREPGELRRRFGMPDALGSCHTARVGGYTVEGHVPARDIHRLLKERPDALGLAVPGMPVGSPGMEAGSRLDPYDVLLVGRDGRPRVYARYGK
jgi:hypothetical protein